MKRFLAILTTFSFLFLFLHTGVPLHAQGGPHLDAKRALARVDTGGAIGTAFAVSPTLVATACHVIKGAAAIQLHFWAAKVRISGRQAMCNERYDVAFIVAAVPEGTAILQFAESKPAQGDQVWVWGYPLGTTIALEPSVAAGVVSATETAEGALALDVSAAPGNSGGPVLNADGKVIGILRGTWNTAGRVPTGFKYAASAETATTLLASLGTPSQAAPATAQLEETASIRPGEGIGSVRLGMTPPEVQAAIGLPPTERYPSGWMVWESRKLAVFFDGGKARMIDTEDVAHVTADGVRIGSTDTELIKAYGAPACSAVRRYRGKAYLGWYYGGLFLFLNGSPRQVFAMRVLPNEAAEALCR